MSASRPPASGQRSRRPSKGRPSRRDTPRLLFVLVTVALLLVVIAGRLVHLQVFAAPAYAEKARAQRMRDVTISPRRGTIYDREGEPLAVSIEARTVYATPRAVKNKARTAATISKVLGIDKARVLKALQRDSHFAYIARKVDLERARQLEAMQIKGIGFLDDSRRTYPSGATACQLLGFVDVDDIGQEGLEKQYDRVLAGTPGELLAERDPYGRPIPGGIVRSIDPINGDDVVLTVDKDIQDRAQTELAAAVKQFKAKAGSVVIMNPRSGEIYAMASAPLFDANEYKTADPAAKRNRPVTDAYEPGSTMKSLTAASVIDKGLFKPTSKFVLPPSLRIGNRTIGEAHGRGTVTWTLTEIVTHSSNIGAVKLGQALKVKGLYSYLCRFGMNERTGVDFPGEVKGWLPAAKDWSALSMANIPFGQGVSMTPLQIDRAISGIANYGLMPTPHFLLSLPQSPDEKRVWPTKRAISEEAAHTSTSILCDVVTEGTGGSAKVPGYSVAGKTGTAQKVREGTRGYAGGCYVGSFIGYLPAEDPQLLISVILDEPTNGYYGGVTAAPTFSRLGAYAASHLRIPPSSAIASSTSDASVTPTQTTGQD